MPDNIKKSRGGARRGAGRPKSDSRIYSFRCPGPLARQLDAKENKTEFIRESLEQALDNAPKMTETSMHGFSDRKPSGVRPLRLPFFDIGIRAGFPVPLDNDERAQDVELLGLLCPHPESSYLIRVVGDSMRDAGVLSGDIVIVDKSRRNPSPRDIAVCELNGEYTLKHLVKENGQAWLVPANPDYPRLPINSGDDFSVWGTVTYIIHKARD